MGYLSISRLSGCRHLHFLLFRRWSQGLGQSYHGGYRSQFIEEVCCIKIQVLLIAFFMALLSSFCPWPWVRASSTECHGYFQLFDRRTKQAETPSPQISQKVHKILCADIAGRKI